MDNNLIYEKDTYICGCANDEYLCFLLLNKILVIDRASMNEHELFIPLKYSKRILKGSNIAILGDKLIVMSEYGHCLMNIDLFNLNSAKEIIYTYENEAVEDLYFLVSCKSSVFIFRQNQAVVTRFLEDCSFKSIDFGEDLNCILRGYDDSFVCVMPYVATIDDYAIYLVIRGKKNDYLVAIDKYKNTIINAYKIGIAKGKCTLAICDMGLLLRKNQEISMINKNNGQNIGVWNMPENYNFYVYLMAIGDKIKAIGKDGIIGEIDTMTDSLKWQNVEDFYPLYVNCSTEKIMCGYFKNYLFYYKPDRNEREIIAEVDSYFENFLEYLCE